MRAQAKCQQTLFEPSIAHDSPCHPESPLMAWRGEMASVHSTVPHDVRPHAPAVRRRGASAGPRRLRGRVAVGHRPRPHGGPISPRPVGGPVAVEGRHPGRRPRPVGGASVTPASRMRRVGQLSFPLLPLPL